MLTPNTPTSALDVELHTYLTGAKWLITPTKQAILFQYFFLNILPFCLKTFQSCLKTKKKCLNFCGDGIYFVFLYP